MSVSVGLTSVRVQITALLPELTKDYNERYLDDWKPGGDVFWSSTCWFKQDLLSQSLTFKLFGITYLVGKIKFELLFYGPLAE